MGEVEELSYTVWDCFYRVRGAFLPVEVSQVVKPVREGATAIEGKALVQDVKGHVLKAVAS